MASSFATLQDVINLHGNLTNDEQTRAAVLLPLVSDALRYEGSRRGRDIDDMVKNVPGFSATIKIVTCDVTRRALRLSNDGEPVSQETVSALGYSYTGTSAIPGGGISNCIMRNDLKRLGIIRAIYKGVELYDV